LQNIWKFTVKMKKFRAQKTVDTSRYDAEMDRIEREFDNIIELFVNAGYFDDKQTVIQRFGKYANKNGFSIFEAGKVYFRYYFKVHYKHFQKGGKV
jgi:hypothetical protein